MNILMVQRFDLLNVSCARRILAMARELVNRKHKVWIAHFPHPQRRKQIGSLFKHLPEGIQYIELDRRGTSLPANRKKLYEAAHQADLVHLWKCYPDAAVPALWAAFRRGLPVHYDWDDNETGIAREMTGSKWICRIVSMWERRTPRLVETVSVASQALKNKALSLGVPAERIFDAPVGADLSRFVPSAEEPRGGPHLVYVGQLEVASFAEMAVRAFAALAERFPGSRLTIAGGGRKLDAVRALVNAFHLEERVSLTGYISADAIPGILQQSHIALAPFEDNDITRCKSPLKIVEYLAAGLPVVASRVGEVPRMLEGCGLSVPPSDASALAMGVRQLMEHPARRQEMRRAARKRAEEIYNWPATVDNLEKAYKQARSM